MIFRPWLHISEHLASQVYHFYIRCCCYCRTISAVYDDSRFTKQPPSKGGSIYTLNEQSESASSVRVYNRIKRVIYEAFGTYFYYRSDISATTTAIIHPLFDFFLMLSPPPIIYIYI